MTVTYKSLHWGERPNHTEDMQVFVGNGEVVGELKACSYVTRKGEESAVYRHQFDRHEGRGPYLLRAATRSSNPVVPVNPPPRDCVAIGRAVDFELRDGRRIVASDMWIVTDPKGEIVCLASKNGTGYNIEQRPEGPYVTNHGIEG